MSKNRPNLLQLTPDTNLNVNIGELAELRYRNNKLVALLNTLLHENDLSKQLVTDLIDEKFGINSMKLDENTIKRENYDFNTFDLVEKNIALTTEITKVKQDLLDKTNELEEYKKLTVDLNNFAKTLQRQIDFLKENNKNDLTENSGNDNHEITILGINKRDKFIQLINTGSKTVHVSRWSFGVKKIQINNRERIESKLFVYKFQNNSIFVPKQNTKMWYEKSSYRQHRPPSDFIMFESQLLEKSIEFHSMWELEDNKKNSTLVCFLEDENQNVYFFFIKI